MMMDSGTENEGLIPSNKTDEESQFVSNNTAESLNFKPYLNSQISGILKNPESKLGFWAISPHMK